MSGSGVRPAGVQSAGFPYPVTTEIVEGPQGPAGPDGPPGPTGPEGDVNITVDGEQVDSIDLDSHVAPADVGAVAVTDRGIPGGVAELDIDGDVVDADGNKVLGGTGGSIDLSGYQRVDEKGVVGGYAELDVDGDVLNASGVKVIPGTGGAIDLSTFSTDSPYAIIDTARNVLVGSPAPSASVSPASRVGGLGISAMAPAVERWLDRWKSGGTVIDDGQIASRWTGAPATDSTMRYRGLPTLKMTSTTSGASKTYKLHFPTPVDMTNGKWVKLTLATDDPRDPALSYIANGGQFRVHVSDDNFATTDAILDGPMDPGGDQRWLNDVGRFMDIPLFMTHDDLKPASTANTGLFGYAAGKAPHWDRITDLSIEISSRATYTGGASAPFNVWFARCESMPAGKFTVSWQDDRPQSQNLDVLSSVVGKYGWGFYVSTNMGAPTGGASTFLTPAQLRKYSRELRIDWGIYDFLENFIDGDVNFGKPKAQTPDEANHTVGIPWKYRSIVDFEDAINRALNKCREVFGDAAVPVLTGQGRKATQDGWDVVEEYYTAANIPNSQIFPQPVGGLNRRFHSAMWANSSFGANTLYENMIEMAARNRQWIVLLFHDLSFDNTQASTGWAPAYSRLQSIAALVNQRVIDMDGEVKNVFDVLVGR